MNSRHVGGNPSSFSKARVSAFRRILVCTDFSEVSELALRFAVTLCNESESALHVLHVCQRSAPAVLPADLPDDGAPVKHVEKMLLQRFVESECGQGMDVTGDLAEGDVRDAILRKIETAEIDLAVVGTRGADGLERLVFGSTCEAIFRSAPCPVMTVGPQLLGGSSSLNSGPVVFATDFNEPAVEAARQATELANLYHTPLHCVHVLPQQMERLTENPIIPSIVMKAMRELTGEGRQCDCEPVFRVLFGSEIANAVTHYARWHHARAIVLGTRRRTSLAAHLPPRITYQIVVSSHCPVVTIPSQSATRLRSIAACL